MKKRSFIFLSLIIPFSLWAIDDEYALQCTVDALAALKAQHEGQEIQDSNQQFNLQVHAALKIQAECGTSEPIIVWNETEDGIVFTSVGRAVLSLQARQR